MMKVLFISQSSFPTVCARSIQVDRVASALQKAGVEMHVLGGLDREIEKNRGNVNTQLLPYRLHQVCFGSPNSAKLNHYQKVIYELYPRSFCLPEFIKNGFPAANDLIERENPDLILSGSTPFTSHRLAQKIKKRYPKLPWLAFFSDTYPWGLSPVPYRRAQYALPFQLGAIKSVLREADALIFPTEGLGHWFAKTFRGTFDESNINIVTPCGPDQLPDDSELTQADLKNFEGIDFEKWILHSGIIDLFRVHPEFIEAVKFMADKNPDRFRGVLLLGNCKPEVLEIIERSKASHCFKVLGNFSPKIAMFLLKKSMCNCICDIKTAYSINFPSKVTEYALARRPILAITAKEGALVDCSKRYAGFYAVYPDREEIITAITDIMAQCRQENAAAPLSPEFCRLFTSESVAAMYGSVFEKALTGRTP